MNKLYLFPMVFLMLFTTTSSQAQKGYLEGHLVMNNGEKIFGAIKDRNRDPATSLYKKIKFKGKKGGKKNYSPNEIQGYQRGNQVFESVYLENKNQFLRVQLPGYMTLYEEEFIDACGPNLDSRPFLKRADEQHFTFVPVFGFRKKMKFYFSDSYEIVKALENKKYRYRDLVQLVADYNQITEE